MSISRGSRPIERVTEVEPTVPTELTAPRDEFVEVEGGDLDRFQRSDEEGPFLGLLLGGVVEEVELAPCPTL